MCTVKSSTATATIDHSSVTFGGKRWKAIDLSQRLSNSTSASEKMPHKIEYMDHSQTAAISPKVFGIEAAYWRNGLGWAQEVVTLSTHAGTHVDAPWHYAPTSAGLSAQTIDELPFQWFMGDGFVLDMRSVERTAGIRQADVERELKRINYKVKRNDIALVRTDVSEHFGEPGYDMLHPGMRECATRFLLDQGVNLIGIDAWGLDRPFDLMVAEAKAGDRHQLWESHYVGIDRPYSQIEKLVNLKALPRPHGFCVLALPIRLEKASGAWSRVIALVPEHL